MKRFCIYTLSHPITYSVFYVGCTYQPKQRKATHMRNKTFVAHCSGLKPVFKIIDTIVSKGGGFMAGYGLEEHWIRQFRKNGYDLLNKCYNGKHPKQIAA